MMASVSTRRAPLQVRLIEGEEIFPRRAQLSSFLIDAYSPTKKNSNLNLDPPPSLSSPSQVRASSSSSSSSPSAPGPKTAAPVSRRNALSSSLLLGAAAVAASVALSVSSPPEASAAVGGVGRTTELAKSRDARKAAMKAKAEAIREKKAGYSQ